MATEYLSQGDYSLKDARLSPNNLLLDPHNPRLLTDFSDMREVAEKHLHDPKLQDKIEKRLARSEHKLPDLMEKIAAQGFMEMGVPIYVKELAKGRSYLVLEGNRRTTAIKQLLREPQNLGKHARKTLEAIPVKVLDVAAHANPDTVITAFLAELHINGTLDWGPLEKANFAYRDYCRRAGHGPLDTEEAYDPDAAAATAEVFHYKATEMKKAVMIAKVWIQLKRLDCPIKPTHFSLLDMCVKDTAVRESYLELDPVSLSLEDLGVEKIADLIIGSKRRKPVVSNPTMFRQFKTIAKEGTPADIARAVDPDGPDLEKIYHRVRRAKKQNEGLERLENILDLMDRIKVRKLAGTTAERSVIKKIFERAEKLKRV